MQMSLKAGGHWSALGANAVPLRLSAAERGLGGGTQPGGAAAAEGREETREGGPICGL